MWKYDPMKVEKSINSSGQISFKPPVCDNCGSSLFRVNRVQMNFQIMEFDINYGAFKEGLQHRDLYGRMVCPHCGHYLGVCQPANDGEE